MMARRRSKRRSVEGKPSTLLNRMANDSYDASARCPVCLSPPVDSSEENRDVCDVNTLKRLPHNKT